MAAQYNLKGKNDTRSLAAFGQVGFEITPTLKLDVGGRYTTSKSTNVVDIRQYGLPLSSIQTVKSDNVSYKVSLGWEATPTQYFYGFVASGFRPGGLNLPVGLGNPGTVRPRNDHLVRGGLEGHLRRWSPAHHADRLLQPLQELPGHHRLSDVPDLRHRAQRPIRP